MISTLKDVALQNEAKKVVTSWSDQDDNAILKRGAKAIGSIAKKQ
jgi:hypothetical protein